MAEGGVNRPAAKLKPVPPPKPTCTPPGNLKKESRKSEHTLVCGDISQESKSSSIFRSAKPNEPKIIVQLQEGDRVRSSKPPLLPKPAITRLPNYHKGEGTFRKSFSPDPLNRLAGSTSKNENVVHQKPLPKLFIPNPVNQEVKNGCVPNTKAPVAKLDEFDCLPDQVSPVRPPRSPKHKISLGSSFNSECSKPQITSRSYDGHRMKKSASLSRAEAVIFESKYKSQSLGRNTIGDVGHMQEGSSVSDIKSPVPPPRRRNKSVPQSPETLVPQFHENTFGLDAVPPKVPVYAEVNYSMKKSRRVESGNAQPTVITSEDTIIVGDDVEQKLNNEPATVQVESETCHSEEKQDDLCESESNEAKDDESESNHQVSSFDIKHVTSSILHDSNSCGETDICVEGCVSNASKELDEVFIGSGMTFTEHSLYPAGQSSEMCNESCTDCLSANILEESYDSVSSSKLEWQSVQSSFNSSGSGSIFEPALQQFTVETIISENPLEDNVKDSSLSGNNSEDKSKYSELHSTAYDTSVSANFCEEVTKPDLSSAICKENIDFSYLLDAKEERYKDVKRLSSSLPNHSKPFKRHHRRKSWNGSKDSTYYVDWSVFKQSSWLDEGDSSSGNLGDLDSSDNAARKSSVEEIDVKSKSERTVGKKLTLWWSSFGKGAKKHRSSKRHSYFYCEKQDSSELDESLSKDNVFIDVKHHSVHGNTSKGGLSETSDPFVSLPVLPVQQDIGNLNEKYTSEESFTSDLHSDSEGEDINIDSSSCGKASISAAEKHFDEKKAFYIAKELMTSEKVFIDALKLLNINFREAIHNAGTHGHSVIPEGDFHKIINSLPQLQRLNEDLLRDLEERIQNWPAIKKIADVIVKKGPFLKLYTTYIQNFESQCNYFDECCQKYPKFAKAVREFEASPVCQKLSIKHYMLKPVQRIPQYRLLLDDYYNHLDPDSPDYEDTKTALKIVCDVAEHANRSIKLGDHLSVLLQLQSQLGNYEIIKPGRILLKGGELYKLSRKERQPRYFILLNDCLLYTSYYGSGPSSGLKVNSELSLGGMKVTTPQAEDYHNEFSIITSTRSFTLSARSSNERREWVDALQTAIQEYTSRQLSFQFQKFNVSRSDGSSESFKLGKEAPIWIQDGRVTKCQSCVAEFTVTFRRHHCRACGKVVCGICSAFRAPLQYMKFQADRVCEECFNTLLSEFDDPANKISEIIRDALGLRRCDQNKVGYIRSQFKRLGPSSAKKIRKHIPQRLLEVTANDAGSQMCGWLQRRSKRSWKRLWFVLKEQVLYVYKASEDVVAHESIPVLGYKVEPMKQIHFQLYEGIDAKLVFQLAHPNQPPIVFSADSENLANRWINALQEATVLK